MTTPATPARIPPKNGAKNIYCRGTAFKVTEKGALFLDFQPGRIIALRPTPARAWVTGRGNGDKWCGLRDPPIDVSSLIREVRAEETGQEGLGSSLVEMWRRRNFQKFLEHVPAEVADLCADGWSGNTWPLFRLLMSSPACRDVCATNEGAAVVFALANAHHILPPSKHGTPPKQTLAFARRWIRRPRKDILGRLGFSAQNVSVKAIGKIPRAQLDTVSLELARRALMFAASFKHCCHIPRLSRAVLAALQPGVLSYCGPDLLASLSNDDSPVYFADSVAREIEDCASLAVLLGKKMPLFVSREHVHEVHDAFVDERRTQQATADIMLPAFPPVLTVDEMSWVRPLRTAHELITEGAVMHHCLGTLGSHVALAVGGNFHALAVDGDDERLTLAVVKVGRDWHVSDLRGPANAAPSPGALEWAFDLLTRLNQMVAGRQMHLSL